MTKDIRPSNSDRDRKEPQERFTRIQLGSGKQSIHGGRGAVAHWSRCMSVQSVLHFKSSQIKIWQFCAGRLLH